MNSITRFLRRPLTAALIGAAGLAMSANAQDCKLSVHASPQVLTTGQSSRVDVHAHFSPTFYAFAAADFDVFGTLPGWPFVSAGFVFGSDVLGISVDQPHAPHLGIFADPSNPIRIWSGLFTPASYEPAFVEIEADPSAFSVYPSRLTSSSVECDAEEGREWIFVNPIRSGEFAVAPGKGTSVEDAAADGFVVTGDDEAILIGLLCPAIQKVRETTVNVAFDDRPDSLTAEVQVVGDQGIETPSLAFVASPNADRYQVHANYPLGVQLQIMFMLDGQVVAEYTSENGETPFSVERVPDAFATSVERPAPGLSRGAPGQASFMAFDCRFNGGVYVAMGDGSVRFLSDSVRFVAQNIMTWDNLKQTKFGAHAYKATGVRSMRIRPIVE